MADVLHLESTVRLVLVCPDCGHANSEYADVLRGMNSYFCRGDDCDYVFDLAPGRRTDFGRSFVEACKRCYAAFYAMRDQGAG